MKLPSHINKPLRIATLVSGRGSNLRAIHIACQNQQINGHIVGVFSDKSNCAALAFAQAEQLHFQSLKPGAYSNRESFDEHLFSLIDAVQPDLIVCAGYLRLISAASVVKVLPKMINIHPSLLPKLPGLSTHARALAAGELFHGCSVHVVTPKLDAGPVISQAKLMIKPNESTEQLSQRVLALEHPLLVNTIAAIASGKITLDAEQLRYLDQTLDAPLQLNSENTIEWIS
jgi:phosphoribosylglycinamide formyltransferase 1